MGAAHGMAIPTIRAHHAWPQDQSRGRNSQATQTYPTTLFCPPTSVKHVKFHLLHSTSSSGLQFPLPLSLWRSCPSPYSCLLQIFHLHRAACMRKREGQWPETSLWHLKTVLSLHLLYPDGVRDALKHRMEWIGWRHTVEIQLGEGKVSSLINNSLKLKAELVVQLQFQLPCCLC